MNVQVLDEAVADLADGFRFYELRCGSGSMRWLRRRLVGGDAWLVDWYKNE